MYWYRACELRDCARKESYFTELAKELRGCFREEVICIFWSTQDAICR